MPQGCLCNAEQPTFRIASSSLLTRARLRRDARLGLCAALTSPLVVPCTRPCFRTPWPPGGSTGALSTLRGVQMAMSASDVIVEALPRMHALTLLDLWGNNLRKGVADVVRALQDMRSLRVADLGGNGVYPGLDSLGAMQHRLACHGVTVSLSQDAPYQPRG